jgi:hypothetical protein
MINLPIVKEIFCPNFFKANIFAVSGNYFKESHVPNPYSIFFSYPLYKIKLNPLEYLSSVKEMYLAEKKQNPIGEKNMDLTDDDDLEIMGFHVLVHSVTGLLEFGTSNTYSIPYWDIQAYFKGLDFRMKNGKCEQQILLTYALNGVRGYLQILSQLQRYNILFKDNIVDFNKHGQVTHLNLSSLSKDSELQWTEISEKIRTVTIAKIKHALFLLDLNDNQIIRQACLNELFIAIKQFSIPESDLEIDLCIDAGLSKNSYRPSYKIFMYKQLNHLKTNDYQIEYTTNHIFSFADLVTSISRENMDSPIMRNPSSDISLPWKCI